MSTGFTGDSRRRRRCGDLPNGATDEKVAAVRDDDDRKRRRRIVNVTKASEKLAGQRKLRAAALLVALVTALLQSVVNAGDAIVAGNILDTEKLEQRQRQREKKRGIDTRDPPGQSLEYEELEFGEGGELEPVEYQDFFVEEEDENLFFAKSGIPAVKNLQTIWWNWEFCNQAASTPKFSPQDRLVPRNHVFLSPLNGPCDAAGPFDTSGKSIYRVRLPLFETVFFPVYTYANVDFQDDRDRSCRDTRLKNAQFWRPYLMNLENYAVEPFARRNGQDLQLRWAFDGPRAGVYESCPTGRKHCDVCDRPRQCQDAKGMDIGPVMGWYVYDNATEVNADSKIGRLIRYEFGAGLKFPDGRTAQCNHVDYFIRTCQVSDGECTSHDQCCDNERCMETPLNATLKRCRCLRKQESCFQATDACCNGQVCHPRTKRCIGCTKLGKRCRDSARCCNDLLCIKRRCQRCRQISEKCKRNSDCCNGNCEEGYCDNAV